MRRASGIAVALLLVTAGSHARGDSERRDGSHGRIDGDVAIAGGVGASFGPRSPRAALDLRFRYLSSAGIFVTYEDGPVVSSTADPRRVFASGVELRPLFFARWLNGLETGNGWVDLTIDSFALELGVAFQQPVAGPFGGRPGLQAGLGMEVPILPSARGPHIGVHGGVRWSDAALGGQLTQGPADRALYLVITASWQELFGAHVVDVGDRRP